MFHVGTFVQVYELEHIGQSAFVILPNIGDNE